MFDSNPNQHHQHLAYGSFDGLTQAQPEQNYLTSLSPPVTSFYGFEDSTTTSQPANTWIPPTSAPSSFSERNANRKCYSFAVNGHGRGHEQLTNPDYSIPRSLPLLFDASMSNHGMPLNPFIDTSVYNTMEPADSEEMQQIMSGRGDFHHRDSPFDMENTRSLARMSISHSPLGNEVENDLFDSSVKVRAPSSEPCDENHTISRGTTVVDVEEHGVEEPYAKLIYRALMSAPDHSMVLQDIYRWFRQNTTKGNDDTKGWMNSIRHNLSMNAVSPSVPPANHNSLFAGIQEDRTQNSRRRNEEVYRMGPGRICHQRWCSVHNKISQRHEKAEIRTLQHEARWKPIQTCPSYVKTTPTGAETGPPTKD